MAGLLILAAVVILALLGVWLKLRGKSVMQVDRFTFYDQEQDRPPTAMNAMADGEAGEETTAPLSQPAPSESPLSSFPLPGESRTAPTYSAIWRLRPVFLTSTFQDFHAERDHLRRVVFPTLEERLQARHHHLVPIDLRWGVETRDLAQDHAKELLILKVCLAEIKRSRPFLIGLLGDRYGWLPPPERIQSAAQEMGFQTTAAGKSVTALEIEYGVLSDPDQRHRSRFYFREPLPYDRMDRSHAARYSDAYSSDPEASAAVESLKALKRKIKEVFKGETERVRTYQAGWDDKAHRVIDLEAWGRQVLEDLWQDLDEETGEFAHKPPETWQDQERYILEQVAEDLTRDFVGRADVLEAMVGHALSPPGNEVHWGLCLVGVSGMGKSAVFAQLFQRLQTTPGVLVLAHAAGISPRSRQVDNLLRRWIGELAAFLTLPDPAPELTRREDLEETFARLLSQASGPARVVCLLDALNQFEETNAGLHLTWLPILWPENARLIATAIPGTQSQALARRPGVEEITLAPLGPGEMAALAQGLCRRYGKDLSPAVLDALLAKKLPDGAPAAGLPLWLALAVDELLLLDEDDFTRLEREFRGTAEEKLHGLLMAVADALPPEMEALYAHLLGTAEKVHGLALTREFIHLLAVTRGGLRESDLEALLPARTGDPWDEARFANLRRSFRAHLGQKGTFGEWDFTHAQMREAIFRRSLPEGELRRDLHRVLADHFWNLSPDDSLRHKELMFHLIGADDKSRAAHFYAHLDDDDPHLAPATRALANHILASHDQEPNPGLVWVLNLASQETLTGEEVVKICNNFDFALLEALENDIRLPLKRTLLEGTLVNLNALIADNPSHAKLQQSLAANHESIGKVLRDQGNLDGALAEFRESLAICKRLADLEPLNTHLQRNLTFALIDVGNVLRYQGDLIGAQTNYQESLAIIEHMPASYTDNVEWQRDLAAVYERLGDVQMAQGDSDGALKAFKKSLSIFTALVASDPTYSRWQRNLAAIHGRVGDALRARGEAGEALKAFQKLLTTLNHLAESAPSQTDYQRDLSISYIKVGDVLLQDLGNYTEALRAYQESLALMKPLIAFDPSNMVWERHTSVSHSKIGTVLLIQGDLAGSLAAYQKCLAIMRRLSSSDPTNTVWQEDLSISHAQIGDVLLARGDLDGALASYRESIAIREQLVTADPSHTSLQRFLVLGHNGVGEVLFALGDLEGAFDAYRKALAIAQRLSAVDPTNLVWQRDLSVSHNKVGEVLSAKGDLAGALKAHRKALTIDRHLSAVDPNHNSRQRDLSVGHDRVGDVLLAQGDLAGALAAFRRSLAIRKHLTSLDPTNAVWQRDLSVSYVKVGDVLKDQGNFPETLAAYRESLAIAQLLAESDSTNAGLQKEIVFSNLRMYSLYALLGMDKQSLPFLEESHKILNSMQNAGMNLGDQLKRLLEEIEIELGKKQEVSETSPFMDKKKTSLSSDGRLLCPACKQASPPGSAFCKFCKTSFS